MKKIKTFLLATVFLTVSLTQYSCIGSFQLTNNLYNWNRNDVGGKWGQELVFLAFVVLPVYSLALLADGIVLNSIEFWTGQNPLAMNDGEHETKIVQQGNDIYQITAERNKLHVEKIGGEGSGETGAFIYNDTAGEWVFTSDGEVFRLTEQN